MLENFSIIMGYLATIFGVFMSLGYFPQTIKMIKRKSSADVSILTYLIFAPGTIAWLLYGLSINNTPLIISNIIAAVGAFSVVITYFTYKK